MLEEGAEGPGLWDSILSSSPTGGLLPPSHSPEVPTDDPQAPLCPEWVRWNWQKPDCRAKFGKKSAFFLLLLGIRGII